jgi:hypothetical protein
MSSDVRSARTTATREGQTDEPLESWRAAIALSVLLVFVGMSSGLIARRLLGTIQWQNLQAMLVGVSAVAFLMLRRSRGHKGLTLSFMVVASSFMLLMTMNQFVAQEVTWPFPPLFGHKVGLVAIALLSSSTAIGLVLVAAFSLNAAVVSSYPGAASPALGIEPWTTLIVGIGAVGILLYRSRARRRRYTLLQEDSRQAAAQQMARTFIAIRDMANTPLQTLSLSCDLLATRIPDEPLLQTMKRSLEQLGRLNEIILGEEEKLAHDWRETDASFDALKEIEASLGVRRN